MGLVGLDQALGVLPYHGTCGDKGAKWASQKAVQREAPSALTKDQKDVHKSAFWSLCTSVCLTVPQDPCKNYNPGKMAHRHVLQILSNFGDFQGA